MKKILLSLLAVGAIFTANAQTYSDPVAEQYPDLVLGDDLTVTDDGTATITELAGKTVRRTILNGNYMYILAVDSSNEPTVLVYDLVNKSVLRTLGTGAATTETNGNYNGHNYMKLSDIALTSDGVLIGINKTYQVYDGDKCVKIYKWDNDNNGIATDDLSVWLTSNMAGNYSPAIAGESMCYTGSSTNGTLVYAASNGTGAKIRLNIGTITNGEASFTYNRGYGTTANDNSSTFNFLTATYGSTFNIDFSPLADKRIIVSTPSANSVELSLDYVTPKNGPILVGTLSSVAPNASCFKVAGSSMMVAPIVSSGSCSGIKLLNIDNGLASATTVKSIDMAAGEVTVHANGYSYVENENAKMALFLLHGNNISKYSVGVEMEEEKPLTRGEYAYNLDMTQSNDCYTFTFDVTGDAPEANIILTDVEGKNADIVYPIGTVTQGHNEFTINTKEEIADGSYYWAVQINSNAIERAGRYFTTTRSITTNTRGGVAFVKDTESDAFGKIVVSNGYAQGIDVYSPEQELEGTTAYTGNTGNAASTFRIAENDGIVYITDWSDAYSGIYTFNPAEPATLQQWYNGTRNSNGAFINANEINIGGGASGLDFVGNGDKAQMYVFSEDYRADGVTDDILVRYDFGGALIWDQAPNKTYPNVSAKLNANANVDLHATENGIFCTQVRSSGNENASNPGLIYVNHEDEILYSSDGAVGTSAGSFAFNKDMTMMAFATQHRGIVVYSIAWNNNVPSFTELYVIPESMSSAGSKECNQLDFDVAGNLHAFLRTDGYCMFVLPNANPTATTAAKKSMLVYGGTLTGVEGIAVDANAPVEYYNMQGVKVENPSNGIFIKKQGGRTSKVVL